jgi:hypothetical protein
MVGLFDAEREIRGIFVAADGNLKFRFRSCRRRAQSYIFLVWE